MTTDFTNLPEGTYFRATDPQVDEGSFGERNAPAGAVGVIEMIYPEQEARYSVMFHPSGICGFWTPQEMLEGAEILPEGHADIPDENTIGFAAAVRDLIYDHELDNSAEQVLAVNPEVVDRLRLHAVAPEAQAVLAEIFPAGEEASSISFADADRLAALSGAADRLLQAPEPAPDAPTMGR